MRIFTIPAGMFLATGFLLAQTSSTQTTTSGVGGQSYTGVLIDANCAQIGNLSSSTTGRASGAISANTGAGGSGAAASSSNVHQPTAEARMQTSAVDQSQVGGTTPPASNTRANTSQAQSSTATGATGTGSTSSSAASSTPPAEQTRSRTDNTTGTANSGATGTDSNTTGARSSSSSTASTSGTTGSGLSSGTTGSGLGSGAIGSTNSTSATTPNASPTGNASTGSSSTTGSTTSAGTAATGATGTGSTATSGASGSTPDVSSCRVTPATNSFALYSNGRVIMLDPASNQRVMQQLQSNNWFSGNSNASARDLNVSVAGTMQGDNLSVSTVTIP